MNNTFRFTLDFQMNLFHQDGIFYKDSNALSSFFSREAMQKCVCIVDEAIVEKNDSLKAMILEKMHQLSAFFNAPIKVQFRAGGEFEKNLDNAIELCHFFEQEKLCRHSIIIVVGGGAMLDLVGFAASLTHRGLRLVRIPTTTLSQCDSGVGVKNGVNAFDKKNFLGCFQPPIAIFNDTTLLTTLSDVAWRDGIAEAMKVALIKDADFFNELISHEKNYLNRDLVAMKSLICHSAELHIHHILRGGDPFENGSARPLDFGHWIAHKLEAMSSYTLSHGSAVAIGVVLDAHQAYQRGLLKLEIVDLVRSFFETIGFTLNHPLLTQVDSILQGLEEFREHLGGRLQITLPNGVGARVEVDEIDPVHVRKAIHYMMNNAKE